MISEVEEWLKILAKDPQWKKAGLRLVNAIAEEKEMKNQILKMKLAAMMHGAGTVSSSGKSKK